METVAAIVLAVLAILAGVALWWWLSKRASRQAAGVAASKNPADSNNDGQVDDRMLERLADMINLLDAGMRSCEIGVWFIDRLAAQAMTKSGAVRCDSAATDMLNIRAIVDEVPGANDVTRNELVHSMTKFVTAAARRACGSLGSVTGPDLARAMRESVRFCTAPDGALLTLYPAISRVPLPV
jgi:hypothetical protein